MIQRLRISREDILILHHELDLPLLVSDLRPVVADKKVSGNRMVQELQKELGEFLRLRMGIGRPESRAPAAIHSYLDARDPMLSPRDLSHAAWPLVSFWLRDRSVGQNPIRPDQTYRSFFEEVLPPEVVEAIGNLRGHSFFSSTFTGDLRTAALYLCFLDKLGKVFPLRPMDYDRWPGSWWPDWVDGEPGSGFPMKATNVEGLNWLLSAYRDQVLYQYRLGLENGEFDYWPRLPGVRPTGYHRFHVESK